MTINYLFVILYIISDDNSLESVEHSSYDGKSYLIRMQGLFSNVWKQS
jgi:hypothetical protein